MDPSVADAAVAAPTNDWDSVARTLDPLESTVEALVAALAAGAGEGPDEWACSSQTAPHNDVDQTQTVRSQRKPLPAPA